MCVECLLFTRYCAGFRKFKDCKVGVLFPGVYNLGRERMTNIASKERRHQLKLGRSRKV